MLVPPGSQLTSQFMSYLSTIRQRRRNIPTFPMQCKAICSLELKLHDLKRELMKVALR